MDRIARRLLTSGRLTRQATVAVIALALALAVATPAFAVQPTRTVMTFAPGVSHYPAGHGCTFDVTTYGQGGRVTVTDFSDGTEAIETHIMHRTIVNDATGATFADNLEAHEVDRIDPATGVIRGSVNGQSIFTFAPGDVGPDGGIVDHNYSIAIFGTVSYVIEGTTFATLAIRIQGTYTDICAAIS